MSSSAPSASASAAAASSSSSAVLTAAAEEALRDKWPRPADNPYNAHNPALLADHLARTGGRVITRFPPEPNGYPHVGHAKAMFIDFGQAKLHNGICYLRFDDTNPSAEKQEYIDAIIDCVRWMGYEPHQITYSSDHFQTLYDLAVKLIRKGKAYVCHQTAEEMSRGRELKLNSPWRDTSVEENLRKFDDMRRGKYAEGEAMLRMKMDMQSANPCMRDLVAYRVLHQAHPHAGDKWCVYPTYDYTHCICDSLEDITHSLCTLEFNIRRESYYWLLRELDLYAPIVWEYSRLNLTHTMVSKRHLRRMIELGIVRGWDDPRMPTLWGMRRRGFSAAAIRAFCEKVGVTRADSSLINYELLEHCVRVDLDANARRTFVVLEPLKVTLSNYAADKVEMVLAPDMPALRDASPMHEMPFSRVLYIDRSDFRLEDSPDYYGLAPGKEVRLKYAYNIRVTRVVMDGERVAELEAVVDTTNAAKTKGFIHWVAEPQPGVAPHAVEVRHYEHLFDAEDMSEVKDIWAVVNKRSETVYKGAMVEPSVVGSPAETKFQAERLAYYAVDKDTTAAHMVLNRVVALRESYPKSADAADEKKAAAPSGPRQPRRPRAEKEAEKAAKAAEKAERKEKKKAAMAASSDAAGAAAPAE